MSSLAFVIYTYDEALNNSIRKEQRVTGLKIKDQEYNFLAFADDLAVILGNPNDSYGAIKGIIGEYGEVAGMRMNFIKTKMLMKTMDLTQKVTI